MNRFKDLLLSVFVLGSIVIIIFILLSFFNIKKVVFISMVGPNENEYNELKSRVNELDESDCKNFLKEYIEYVDKGHFEGEVKIKDLYDYYMNAPVLELYENSKLRCNLTDEELSKNAITSKYITILSIPESFFQKYTFSYELNLKDGLRELMEPNVDSLLLTAVRSNQIDLLAEYLDVLSERENVYE